MTKFNTISFDINSIKELDKLAKTVSKTIKNHDTVCFYADLGMGKTSFCQFLLKHLGVKDKITSPSYSIINTYSIESNKQKIEVNHLDLYRLHYDELFELGIEEVLSSNINLIEWAEKLEDYTPKDKISFTITSNSQNHRHIEIKYNTETKTHWTNLEYKE